MASSLFCRSAGLYRDSNASAAPSGSASNNNNNSTNKQKQLRVLNYSTINLPPPSSPSPSPSPASPSTVHNDFLGYAPLAISASASDLSSLHCVFQGSDSAMSRFPEPSYDNSESSSSSCFMSSISDDNEEEDDEEVQSSSFDSSSSSPPSSSSSSSSSDTLSSSFPSLKQSGALDTFDSLASALPIKRGLSSYFRGKSQSFSCLGAISTVAELAKPEDPFAKKRRTSSNLMKKYRSHPSRCGSNGAISKRHSSSNGSTGLRSHARSPRSHHHHYMKPLPSSKCFSVPELQEAAAF